MENEHVSMGTLQKLRECPEKIAYGTLGKSDAHSQKMNFLYHCIDLLKEAVMQQDTTSKLQDNLIRAFDQGYQKCWFELSQAYTLERQKNLNEMMRLGNYLLSRNVKRCIADAPFLIQLPSAINCNGTTFSAVSGKADLILFYPDGSTEAINFFMSKPKYSYMARTESNNPTYAPELLALKLGFEYRYPGIKASLFYLKNKDDKGNSLEPYENRKGKNIISADYKDADVMATFLRAISIPVKKDCTKCRYESVCETPILWQPKKNRYTIVSKKNERAKDTKFTDAQKEVIYHKDGPMNCIAVPGAGKTTCLVQRMLYLMETGVRPNHILFVTFTQKAAQEIKERVWKELKKNFGTCTEKHLPNIYTFNGLGYQILKENPVILGKRVKLASQIDRFQLIREILEKVTIQGMSYSGIYLPDGLIPTLERYFERIELFGEDAFKKSFKGKDPDGILMAYQLYQEEFQKRELVTYDMQISLCRQLLEDPELAEVYSHIFQYIMVDEFQDVSKENAQMIYSIAKCHNNLVVVGDDDQSIYSFRGGSNYYMLHFSEDFPSAKTVIMADNFRSTTGIIQAASSIIEKNQERFPKKIISHHDDGKLPLILQEFSERNLLQLVRQIHHVGYSYGDIAILARYNKTLQKAKELLTPSIKCTNPKDYVIKDAVFVAIADVLELYFQGIRDIPLYRLFKAQGIDLKKVLIDKPLMECLYEAGTPQINAAFLEEPKNFEPGILHEALCNIRMAMDSVEHAKNIPDLLSGIMQKIFHLEHYPVLSTLESLCDERAISNGKDLLLLMRDMILFSDQTRIKYEPSLDEVRLLTAHDSKGMEFPAVILLSLDEFDDTEEERRLLYVAFTRTKQFLAITKDQYAISKFLPDLLNMTGR